MKIYTNQLIKILLVIFYVNALQVQSEREATNAEVAGISQRGLSPPPSDSQHPRNWSQKEEPQPPQLPTVCATHFLFYYHIFILCKIYLRDTLIIIMSIINDPPILDWGIGIEINTQSQLPITSIVKLL